MTLMGRARGCDRSIAVSQRFSAPTSASGAVNCESAMISREGLISSASLSMLYGRSRPGTRLRRGRRILFDQRSRARPAVSQHGRLEPLADHTHVRFSQHLNVSTFDFTDFDTAQRPCAPTHLGVSSVIVRLTRPLE